MARIYTTLNQYYVILEVDPGYQLGPNALTRIYAKSSSGVMTPLNEFASYAVQKATQDLHMPRSIVASFQGNALAFQNSLSSTPILILAALVAVYLILGMLYESTIHPLTIISTLPSAALGALLTLMLFGMPLDVIGIVGIILLIGIVKKNGIVLVDFALTAERERGLSSQDAIH